MSKKHVMVFVALAFAAVLLAGCVCLYVFVIDNIAEEITIEAGTVPSPEAFLIRPWSIPVAFETSIDTAHPGDYPVRLKYCRRSYDAVLHIRDTTPPQGKNRDLTVLAIDPPQPEDFLTEVRDVTQTSAAFGTAPDMTQSGDQTVTVLLTDEGGNFTEVSATLNVIIDTQPPKIEGAKTEFLLYQGDTVSYRSGVTVSDDIDEDPAFTIESSGVDLSTPGEYPLLYIASDNSGNVSVVESKVTVLEKRENYVDLETIHQTVTDLLRVIIREDMTVEQQVRAIHRWIHDNYTYIYQAEKLDYHQSGYAMLVSKKGNCYNYFALCKLMLEELGIPNIDVVKVKNYREDSNHYWSLVSVDGGQTWYHLDTSPRPGGAEFCLVSDGYLDDFSRHYRNCFNRDKSLYPATPEDNL